jgi:ferric-dicitrate binding protein FerR (iron transport regulator)
MNTDEKEFLQNSDFIAWALTGDSEIEQDLAETLKSNPEKQAAFDRAMKELNQIAINKQQLTAAEDEMLKQRILRSAASRRRQQTIRHITRYAAAAAVAAIIFLSLYYYFINAGEKEEKFLSENIIIGENMDDKEISLISDAAVTTFSKDVKVRIDSNGKTIVSEENGTETILPTSGSKMNKLIVPYGKRSQLELSDGTKVWLNSGSVLEFPATFTTSDRIINLAGEMYIEVEPDTRPFYVNTADFRVKVYGTKFNISAYTGTEAQSVVLVEGRVSVKSRSKDETFLSPSEKLACTPAWSKQKVDIAEYISWKDGYIMLDHTPIVSVLKRLEKYYNLSFDIQENINLESHTCTGKIYLSEDLDEVINAVAILSSTKYTRKEKTIYIQY